MKLKFEGMKDNSTGFFFGPMAEITIPVIGLGVDGALLYSQKGDKMEGLDTTEAIGADIPVNPNIPSVWAVCWVFYVARSGLLLQLQG